jgi:hypothetical protein
MRSARSLSPEAEYPVLTGPLDRTIAETGCLGYAEGPISARNCRLCCGVALLSLCAPQMEDAMCYAKDYKIFDDQKKAEDTRVVQERRAGLIDRLLNAASKHGEKTKAEETPVKQVAPAK